MKRKMKDSGIDWIGEIPEEWEVLPVKSKYKLVTGFTPDTGNPNYYDDNGYVWVNISDLSNDRYITDSKKKISALAIKECKGNLVKSGSLLYSFKLSVGQVAFAGGDLYTNEAIASFIEDESVNLEFFYYMSSFAVIQNANENIYGAKLLNQQLIKNAKVVFPSLNQQQAIATFLDQKCSEIDHILEKTRESIEEYKKLKQSIITEAVTKGLNRNVEMKESGIEWIGEIPRHWEVRKLKYTAKLSNNVLGEKTPSDYKFRYVDIGSVSFEKGIETYEEMMFQEAPSRARRIVSKGDIIISTVRTYLKAIAAIDNDKDVIVSTGFAVLTPREIEQKFLEYISKSNYFVSTIEARSYGVSYPAINALDILELKIAFPSNDEQKSIIEYLERTTNSIDLLVESKKLLISDLEAYKKSLIFECVTGKREVEESFTN